MHPREADAPQPSGRSLAEPGGGIGRFDGETVRQILRRAAAEQQRLNNELSGSYSVEELEDIAAEAGISSEALRAAVEAQRRNPATAPAPGQKPSRPFSLNPRNWSRTVVLTSAGGVAFLGSLLLFPAFAQTVLWVLFLTVIVLSVLILLGASPF